MNGLSRNSNGEIQENKKAKTKEKETKNRLCDFCGEESKAILYCRADTAKLCLNCDYQVHSTNPLFTKHTRSLLCDVCDSSPSSIFCSRHSSVLCQNCDWESHGLVSLVHDRRPLDGFIGCPSVTELLATFGIEDLGQKKNKNYGFDDCLIWGTPSLVGLDDDHNFMAASVPPLPKNRNTICGQHREEIICQLRQMAKLEPNYDDVQFDIEPSSGFHSLAFKDNCQLQDACFDFEHVGATYVPSYAASAFELCSHDTGEDAGQGPSSTPFQNFVSINCMVPYEKTETGQYSHQVNNGHETQAESSATVDVARTLPNVAPRQFSSQERDHALARYKEKKKSRRYEKLIRYEARKIRAENRPRIRGRFAKTDH